MGVTLAEAWAVCADLDRLDAESRSIEAALNARARTLIETVPNRPNGGGDYKLCGAPRLANRQGACRRKDGHDGKHRWWRGAGRTREVAEW